MKQRGREDGGGGLRVQRAETGVERNWLFGKVMRAEDVERNRRENKVASLLLEDEYDGWDESYDSGLMSRLLKYMDPYRKKLVVAVTFMIASSVLGVLRPWMIAQAIDYGIKTGDLSTVRMWVVLFMGAAIAEFGLNRGRILLMAFAGTRVVADMRGNLFSHLHALSLNFHNNYSVGRLMSRLISDVGVMQEFVTWWFTGMARSLFVLLGIVVAMLVMNWQLALLTITIMPLMLLLTNYWRKHVRRAYRATRRRLSLINGYLNESITGIRVTKGFTREKENSGHFGDLNLSYFEANVETARLAAIYFPGVDFMGSLASALVVGVGGWFVLGDTLSAGVLVAFLLYVDRLFEPMREMAERYNLFQATMAASERVFGLIDMDPDLVDRADAVTLPTVSGTVDFEDVYFSYRPDEEVLRGVTIHAKPGETVALVGETGAGKSTVIRLLARFFDVTAGSIRVDGHDVREVTMQSLRSQLGIVLQDTFIFGGTIFDNIRYGNLEASSNDVLESAKAVGADEFISALPNSYQTEVGENGVNLSMGQRQLLSFARALLANPAILILDEATSSIDTANERRIQEALSVLLRDRTSFVIAHRLNTIVNANQIVVLDAGKVMEHGTHYELLERRGIYYNLYTMQWTREETWDRDDRGG